MPSNIPKIQANNPIIMISNTYIPEICSLFIPKVDRYLFLFVFYSKKSVGTEYEKSKTTVMISPPKLNPTSIEVSGLALLTKD